VRRLIPASAFPTTSETIVGSCEPVAPRTARTGLRSDSLDETPHEVSWLSGNIFERVDGAVVSPDQAVVAENNRPRSSPVPVSAPEPGSQGLRNDRAWTSSSLREREYENGWSGLP
jgi:hypothetical protein